MNSSITEKSNNWVKKNPILYLIICILSIPVGLYFGNSLYDSFSGKKIEGSIVGNTYIGSTKVNLDFDESINSRQGTNYGHIVNHVWKIVKNNPNITKVDINFIFTGDDGYGNKKTSDWCHLIFEDYEINQLKKYNDIGSMTRMKKTSLLNSVGMSKLNERRFD
jgi:hypothetical protein